MTDSRYKRKHRRPGKARLVKVGQEAGTLAHIGAVRTDAPSLALIEYNDTDFRQTGLDSVNESRTHQPLENGVKWLNVYGLQDPAMLEEIGRRYKLHPLVVEDMLNTQQRPKVEDYGDYLFIVTRTFGLNGDGELDSDQISIVLGRDFVLSVQERPTGRFEALRERLRTGKGQARKYGPDYLAYALLDAVVDYYFITLDRFADQTDQLDDMLLAGMPIDGGALHRIRGLKLDALELRRAMWPLREAINTLVRGDHDLVQDNTRIFLRDVYDHATQLIESLDLLRDLISDMVELYQSNQSNRLNREMRFLTVVSTLFMPLTFIVGVYGMNFEFMPELHWRYGYFLVWSVMIGIVMLMGWVFWRRRWL